MLALTLASLRLHHRRYAAAGLAIMLGVGFCALTFAMTAATKKGLGDALVQRYSAADVVVRAARMPVDSAAIEHVNALPEVADTALADSTVAQVAWPDRADPTPIAVGEIATAEQLRWQQLRSGALPVGSGEFVVDASTVTRENLEVGDVITLTSFSGGAPHRLTLVGVLDTIQSVDGADTVFVADGAMDAWNDRSVTSEMLVSAAAGISPDALRNAIAATGGRWSVLTTDQAREQATSGLTDDVDVLGLVLLAFAAIALFVAALVTANTFTIVVAQRSRDLALLRCIGAERRHVFATVLLEALVLGV
ncbi:MAG: ABC transporter permease, partial [Propionibacteriales bacterium]|nr:ABC transporter permease [Propionibacteriales bacterium]